MRLVASIGWALYVLDSSGRLHLVPSDGRTGYQVPYLDCEARSLRRQAAEYRAERNPERARELDDVACAIEALADVLPAA